MPGGRPRKSVYLKQGRRKSGKGMVLGGVGDDAERIADAIARIDSGRGRPLDTMLLSVLVSLLLVRKEQGQAMPSPHYLRKYEDDDIRQAFDSNVWVHQPAEDNDPDWQQGEIEMQAAGFSPAEIQLAKDQWSSIAVKIRGAPSASTIARYLNAAIAITQEL